jgi:four helix bundle protein
MNFDEWVKTVPRTITGDPLWKVEAYRLGLFAADIGWHDVTKLMQDKRTLDLSDQLYRSLGSISANIAEGYSKSTGKDRARFYEYALGSARESRDWYYKSRYILGDDVTNHRLNFMTQIVRLLITMVPQQRTHGTIREDNPAYETGLDYLLNNIPLPTL